MALSIATNTAALQASAAASSVNRDLETSMARLSTGKRINSARDDAAGVAIASRLSSEIRGTDQAIRNALDGQALIDTAEGGHKEIENVLQRMREVAVQSANDTNDLSDRANLQAEIKALVTEIDRIASVTTWAGQTMMSDIGSKFTFQVGTATGDKNQIGIDIKAMSKTALGISGGATAGAINPLASGVGVVGDSATGMITLGSQAAAAYTALIENKSLSLANAAIDTTKAHRDETATGFAALINNDPSFIAKGILAVAQTDAAVLDSTAAGGGAATNLLFTGSATLAGARFEVVGTDVNGIAMSELVIGSATTNQTVQEFLTVETITQIGDTDTASTTVTIGTTANPDGVMAATDLAAGLVAFGATADNVMVNARVELLHGADDMSTAAKARHAVSVIDGAIKSVNTQRSELGAVSNRLSHTVSNLTNISANLSAARGGIEDADFALETTSLAKNQILQQASTAMLAQANAAKQNVLSLLQG